jgi:rSAM/selenodomain-associated transferase 2
MKVHLVEKPVAISIVIPTLDEADNIERCLRSCSAETTGAEIIVVDGGSSDETVQIARRCGARVLEIPGGRARQMNAGAEAATGGILLFLHADSVLPHGYSPLVREALGRGAALGAFRLALDSPGIGLRIMETGTRFRSRILRMPYGDQGLFLTAETFREAGGFPDLPVMEDYEFVRRCRRIGKLTLVDAPVTTSARRWLKKGPWKTWWINQGMVLGYRLGVDPSRLARWYRGR